MADVVSDCTQDFTNTTGTGTLTLLATPTAPNVTYQQGVGDGNTCVSKIEDGNGLQWEVSRGVYTNSSKQLTRATVLSNSSGNTTPITLSATTPHKVYVVDSGQRAQTPGSLWDLTPRVPRLSGFTQVTQGSTTISENAINGSLSASISVIDTGTNTLSLSGVYKAVPSLPYRIAMLVTYDPTLNSGFPALQWGFSDGTKFHTIAMNGSDTNWYEQTWSNSTTRVSAGSISSAGLFWYAGTFWVGCHDDNAGHVLFEVSRNGKDWLTIRQTTKSSGYLGSSGYSNAFVGIMPDTTISQFLTLYCWDTNGLNRVAGY